MSNGDKRSVATDALETLGTLIDEYQKRDAIHLAVEPMVAGMPLRAGDHVRVEAGRAYVTAVGQGLGIVDPFIQERQVELGQRFWLVIYPRQIHSLRHVWTHPAFTDEPEVAGMAPKLGADAKAASEKWLREFIRTADCPDYDTVIAVATDTHVKADYYGSTSENDGEYLFFAGQDAHGPIPPEFWDHVEIVTGKKITKRAEHFSCSC